MGECNHSFRGVLVYIIPKADIHQQLGFYTEKGMIYITAYGSRKSKNLHKRTLSIFTMGKIFVIKTKNKKYTFKDIEVYKNGEHLGANLLLYYSSCVCIELVRYLVGADHHIQFKLLVDVLLYSVSSSTVHWKESLAFFLWQSLANNGWQPDFTSIAIGQHNDDEKWLLFQNGKVIPYVNNTNNFCNDETKCVLSYSLAFLLQNISKLHSKLAIESFSHINSQLLSQFVKFLIHQWKYLLGRKLMSMSFLQKYL